MQIIKPTPGFHKSTQALTIFLIGVGSAFAKTLYQTNFLIMKGPDWFLVDCGPRCTWGLIAAGVPMIDINTYHVTHSHNDHIGGLEEVMMMGRYAYRKKPNIIITEEYEKILWEESLKGGSTYSEEKNGKYLEFSDFWNVVRPLKSDGFTRQTWEANVGGINLKMPRTKHIPDSTPGWETSAWSTALILDNKVMLTSDTRFDQDLLEEFDGKFNLEVIFHDCQLFTGGVHSSIDELSALPLKLRKKIILTHYGDNWQTNIEKMQKAEFHSFARQQHCYIF